MEDSLNCWQIFLMLLRNGKTGKCDLEIYAVVVNEGSPVSHQVTPSHSNVNLGNTLLLHPREHSTFYFEWLNEE